MLGARSSWLFPWLRRTSAIAVRLGHIPPVQSWGARKERCFTGALGMGFLAALRLGSVARVVVDVTFGTFVLAPSHSGWPDLEPSLSATLEWVTPFRAVHPWPRLP